MLTIIWAGLVAFFAASFRRISRGPSSKGWSWKLEWIVAVQRAVLGAMIDWPPPRIRKIMVERIGPLARGLDRTDEELGGVPCERSTRPGSSPNRHVLYIHGGGFTLGSIASHREVVSAIATYGDLCAHSVAYRQPPEDKFPAAVEDVVAAYRGLLDSGIRPEQISIAGDSAGGNLCLALLLRAKADGLPMPASAALICPAPDMALPGKSWNSDPFLDYLTRPVAQSWLEHYVDPDQYKDPLASPIHGDLRGLPPILIQAGGGEGLLDEIESLVGALRQAGVSLTYDVKAEMPHVWHLFVGLIPESEDSLREIAAFINETTHRDA